MLIEFFRKGKEENQSDNNDNNEENTALTMPLIL